ncbi:MAG TPA: methylated-DNA--[protein]-cysteine S-methyltransferase [Egibacteraceae bacterium]|nr:methylated-DNA--[protein]-cysteine S-methyltransferase [Egibacteraceae bacterium]
MTYTWTTPSPLGDLRLLSDGRALTGVYMPSHMAAPAPPADARPDRGPFGAVLSQLEEYFAGERRDFDVVLAATGTEFQRRVWAALTAIPYGATVSYRDVAEAIGAPTAVRAVGLANGRNPISIIVPCHRVVGANGSLTGYGGGIANKRYLLDLERRVAGVSPTLLDQPV